MRLESDCSLFRFKKDFQIPVICVYHFTWEYKFSLSEDKVNRETTAGNILY